MKIQQLKGAATLAPEKMQDLGIFKNENGPDAQLRAKQLVDNEDGSNGGVWEATPGTFPRQSMQAELTTFLQGHAIFYPEHGDPIEVKAGDVIFFPENCKGMWEVRKTLRKTYLSYDLDKG